MARVAALIIGHEILTGKFADENGPFLIQRLRRLGSELGRLVVLEDDIQAIAREVAYCVERFDAVITTGGVGPTHDDVTLEAVAAGLGVPVVEHPELIALMKSIGVPLDDSNRRMAQVPEGTDLVRGGENRYPVVRCGKVWVFPGVPRLFQRKFTMVESYFSGEPLHTARVTLVAQETDIASRITAIAAAHSEVVIGSYPRFETDPQTVILTFESSDADALRHAEVAVRQEFHDLL